VGVGVGAGGVGAGAATSLLPTLSAIISDAFLATRMPISVVMEPVINRTMSFNILVYAKSMGAIVFMGCATKVTEYNMVATRPPNTSMTTQTTKAHTITSQKAISSSVVWNSARGGLRGFNFLLQYRCYEVIRTVLSKQTIRPLAALFRKVFRVLAEVSVTVFTTQKGQKA